jgi:inhibitor of cysteine peptidase
MQQKIFIGSVLMLCLSLVSTVRVESALAATCTPQSLVATAYGQTSGAVTNLQQCLIDAGYSIPAGATGYFGAQTQTAVKEFYRTQLNISDWDGRSVGPQGRSMLQSRVQTGGNKPTGGTSTGEAKAKAYAYKKVSSEAELLSYVQAESYYDLSFGVTALDVVARESLDSAAAAPLASANSVSKSESSRVSTTNVQVAGIDEADIVKTDGEHLFISPQSRYFYFSRGVESTLAFEDSTSDPKMMPPISHEQPNTKVVDAFPLTDLAVVAKDAIAESGDMLLVDDVLVIFTYDTIVAYDVTNPKAPKKKWDRKYGENVQLVTARSTNGTVYLVTSTYLNRTNPCPVVPLINAGMILPCARVWVPEHLENLNTSYSILALNPENGNVTKDITLAGKADNTVVAMFEDAIYVTHRESSGTYETMMDFYESELTDLLSAGAVSRIKTIRGYDISASSKIHEIENVLQSEIEGKSTNETLRIQTEMGNRMENYLTKHMRDIDRTIVSRINVDTLTIQATKSIPGHLLNQFSLDEYNGYLRMAVTVGDRWGGGTQVNDVYVLNSALEIVGKVLDLGFTEQVYSARFIGNRGYVVTFRQTDPFYVFDLSDPLNPKMTGELKIPGYSSYLEVIDENTVLGVGREGGSVKIALFDVSNPALPTERAKYMLSESWSDVENNHHAFLKDSKHQVVFIPASSGGHILSYAENKLTLKAAVSGYDVRRAVYLDDYLYVIGDSKITVLNENTWKEEATLEI